MVKTYGYDIVHANTIASVNANLENYFKSNPLQCTFSSTTEESSISINATYGAWQLVPGGSNQLLRLHVPFATGTMTIKSPMFPESSGTVSLNGVSSTVEIQLGWVDGEPVQAMNRNSMGKGASNKLAFHMEKKGRHLGDSTPGAVTVVSVDDPLKTLNEVQKAVLESSVGEILIESHRQVNYIFASLVENPAGPFPAPVSWKYLYQESSTGIHMLVILVEVEENEKIPSSASFDASILNNTDDVYTIVSEKLFLEFILLPALRKAYNTQNLKYQSDNHIVQAKKFNTKTAKWAATHYYPEITKFRLGIDGTNISIYVEGKCDITGLVDAFISYSGTMTSKTTFDPTTKTFKVEKPTGNLDSSKHVPWWEYLLLAGLADLILSLITDSVSDSIMDAVKEANGANLGKVSVSCNWGGKVAKVVNGGLSGAFWQSAKLM